MNKSIFFLLVHILLPLLLLSCGKKNQNPAVKEETLPLIINLGFSTNMADPRAVSSVVFKNEVENKSKGKIRIAIHPDGKLGGDGDLIEGVIKETLDMTVSSAGNFAAYATKVGISALPFLFYDFDQAWKFMDSQLVKDIDKTLEEFGIVVLAHYDNGFRCVTTTDRRINSVSDIKGLNIRTPPNQIVMETMLELGASPKPYAFNELKKALREGIFDSQENPVPVIFNSRLFEEQKYLAITNHSYDAMPLVIRKKLWDGFSDEEKSIILEAARKSQIVNRKLIKEQTASYVSKLEAEGMIITRPDLLPFQQATSDVIDVFTDIYGENLIEKVRMLVGK